MYKQITIKTLHNQGEKKSQIARELGCHRNTVSNIVKRDGIIEKQTRVRSSIFDPYKQQIFEYLDKKISRLRIFELLGEEYGVMSTYINLCKYIQNQFPKKTPAYGVQTAEPGESAEIDFGYLGMLPGYLGRPVKTYGLAVILPYSKLDFYAICYDQRLDTLVKELRNAFNYFGGVPKRLKVDNMKTAILRNQHYDLEFNNEADIKRQLRSWLDGYANQRIHGTTRKVPKEVFGVEEKDKLQPLPEEEFAFFNRCVRIVLPNCHVHFENNYYIKNILAKRLYLLEIEPGLDKFSSNGEYAMSRSPDYYEGVTL